MNRPSFARWWSSLPRLRPQDPNYRLVGKERILAHRSAAKVIWREMEKVLIRKR